jgi:sterol desaturase/sphingolipid hydroxylase (fatty acid hydroxylase superfamily)
MDTIVSALIPIIFVVMLVVERLAPGKPLPRARFWLLKGFVFFVLNAVANALIPLAVSAAFGGRSLVHLGWLGVGVGAVVSFLTADFVGYWVHRGMHTFPGLWRWTHQMHHSAERMDLAGLGYAHPLDILLSFGLPTVAGQMLGFSADAATLGGLLGYLLVVLQHSNVRTPVWLGYVIMRPEAHGLHHERGIHAYNYATAPLWDVVFGTYRNPAEFPEHYGFWQGASSRMGAMLAGRDVGQPGAVNVTARETRASAA